MGGNFVVAHDGDGCAIICPPLNNRPGRETYCGISRYHLIAELARQRLRRASQRVARKAFGRPVGIEVQAFIDERAQLCGVVARRATAVL
jgi:hypothetical protein